jgi:hypothetical protein
VKTDRCTIKQMTDALAQGGKLPALIQTLVTSDTFTQRRAEQP